MTIRLGIIVVYLASENHGALIDLHLGRIERHTSVPFTIYGSVNRLAPEFRRRLEQHPNVKLFEFPPTEVRGWHEHSYYLEQLIAAAIGDGVTHIAILHLDSFPVRDGWAEELTGRLSETCVFATIEDISTACLVFGREFYSNHKPVLVLSDEESKSEAYRDYLREVSPIVHSGIGYGFKAHQNGLGWHYMRETSHDNAANGPAVYDGLLFHLRGAIRLASVPSKQLPGVVRWMGFGGLEGLARAADAVVPNRLKRVIRTRLSRPLDVALDHPRLQLQSEAMAATLEMLLANPDDYLSRLIRESG